MASIIDVPRGHVVVAAAPRLSFERDEDERDDDDDDDDASLRSPSSYRTSEAKASGVRPRRRGMMRRMMISTTLVVVCVAFIS